MGVNKGRRLNHLFGRPNKYQTGGKQHLWLSHIKEEVGSKTFNDYFKFSFTRNPFDKAVSQYFFTKKRPRLLKKLRIKKNSTFRTYVLAVLSSKTHVQWDNQYKFIYFKNECLADFVGKVENLQEDFNFVCDRIGIPKRQLQHKNKTNHKHYTEYYDEETREIVAEKYAEDIELFGYQFGE